MKTDQTLRLAAAAMIAGGLARAATNYVAWDGDGSDGRSWATAWTNLHDAVSRAATGDYILIKRGTYNVTNEVVIGPGTNLTVVGGYAGDGEPGTRSEDPSQTVIQRSSGVTRVLRITNATVRVEGVTLQNGATPNGVMGANVSLWSASTEFVNCVIQNGTAAGTGDRVHGQGIYIVGGTSVLQRCIIQNNGTVGNYGSGGGVYATAASVFFDSCIIRGNRANGVPGDGGLGGGLFISGSGRSRLFNCLIAHNVAGTGTNAGGVQATHDLSVENCTFVGNLAIGLEGNAQVTVSNSVFWGHLQDIAGAATGRVFYTLLRDAAVAGPGVLHADPAFQFGYYLSPTSPAIDAGSVTAVSVGLDSRYAQAAQPDSGIVDLGYHAPSGHVLTVTNLYVDPVSGNDSNPGTGPGPGQAFKTVTRALAQAQVGTTIYLAPGTYSTNTGETLPLFLDKDAVRIVGTDAATTILSGANTSRVMVVHYVSDQAFIKGVTIADGRSSDNLGAGLWLQWTRVRLEDCILQNNFASHNCWAGGMGIYFSAPTVENCLFQGNRVISGSGGGGGARILDGCPVFRRCVFRANYGGRAAGVLHGVRPLPWTLVNCLILSNHTDGAIYPLAGIIGGTVYLTNCTVAEHSAYSSYVAMTGSARSVIANCIFWGNANDLAGELVGTGRVSYSCFGSGLWNGTNGCTSANPEFVDRTYFHLKSTVADYRGGFFSGGTWGRSEVMSPCIDAGDPAADWSLEPDYPRGRINMGAYGGTEVASWGPRSRGSLFLVW